MNYRIAKEQQAPPPPRIPSTKSRLSVMMFLEQDMKNGMEGQRESTKHIHDRLFEAKRIKKREKNKTKPRAIPILLTNAGHLVTLMKHMDTKH